MWNEHNRFERDWECEKGEPAAVLLLMRRGDIDGVFCHKVKLKIQSAK